MNNPVANPVNWPATSVEIRQISELKPYANNPRTHTLEDIKQIASSMREWGWTIPVLIDEDNMILAGHGRVEAAKRNGYREVPVIVARGWTDAQKRAYVIADNRLTENGGWNKELLGGELTDLKLDFDLDLLGFTDKELNRLLGKDEIDEAMQLTSKFEILVTCENEQQQAELLAQLSEQGLSVRALLA